MTINGKSAMLTRDEIIGKKILRTERVEIPEWDGAVNVRELTGAERDEVESWITRKTVDSEEQIPVNRFENVRGKVAAKAIVDDSGLRLFSDDDAETLGQRSAAALDRIFTVALRLSGMTKEERARLEKNLQAQPERGGGSISA